MEHELINMAGKGLRAAGQWPKKAEFLHRGSQQGPSRDYLAAAENNHNPAVNTLILLELIRL